MKIGILGGIGPESTSYFYDKLISSYQSSLRPKSNSDFPHIIINSIPAPEITYSGRISDSDLALYKQGISELNQHSPDFIIMVCNTIHLFYDSFQESSKSEIIDMRQAVAKKLNNNPGAKVCVLGTPGTIAGNLYSIPEGRIIGLSPKDISLVSCLIDNYNLGINKDKQIATFKELLGKIRTSYDGVIILGCTELSLLNSVEDKMMISSLDVMVEEAIRRICLHINN
jgi:aspartate racemase